MEKERIEEELEEQPKYPIIERTDAAQIGKTVLDFSDFDDMGCYIQFEQE
jgi:hypothetical protein